MLVNAFISYELIALKVMQLIYFRKNKTQIVKQHCDDCDFGEYDDENVEISSTTS